VSTDAVLAKNLTCTGDGVIITGDGVIVDLGHHTIRSSTGTGSGIVVAASTGATATVKGPGRVKGFLRGIDDVPRADQTASLESDPLPSSLRHHVIVSGVTLVDNSWGVQVVSDLTDVTGTTIQGVNGIGGNGNPHSAEPSVGIVNLASTSVTSTGIALDTGGGGAFDVGTSRVSGGSIFLTVNVTLHVADSKLLHVDFGCSDGGVSIERSRLVNTPLAIGSVCGSNISDNVVRSTQGGTGIGLMNNGPFTSVIDGNQFSGWDDAIDVSLYNASITITDNHFQDNVTGIRSAGSPATCVSGSSSTGAIRNNTLVRNSGDAIYLDCGEWAVGNNRMVRNGGLGINASGPDVQITDEGGNIASRNMQPQCVGVVCVPR